MKAAIPKNFIRVPKYLVRDFRVPIQVRMFMVVLRSYAYTKNECWPSYETVAKDLGCSVRQVHRYAEHAESVGWLDRRPMDPHNPSGKTRFILNDYEAEKRFQKLADPERKLKTLRNESVTPMSVTPLTPMSHEEEEDGKGMPLEDHVDSSDVQDCACEMIQFPEPKKGGSGPEVA